MGEGGSRWTSVDSLSQPSDSKWQKWHCRPQEADGICIHVSSLRPLSDHHTETLYPSCACVFFSNHWIRFCPLISERKATPKFSERLTPTSKPPKAVWYVTLRAATINRFWDLPNASRFSLDSILSLDFNSRWRSNLVFIRTLKYSLCIRVT